MSDVDVEALSLEIRERINLIEDRIHLACSCAGRRREDITLIGVSKVFPVEYAQAAVKAGLVDLGENRVQELVPKSEALAESGLEVKWHLIGTLQKNKVKYIIGRTHLIHSVDSIELAHEIDRRSSIIGVKTDVLIQANISGEESKHGFAQEELNKTVYELNNLENVNLRGIMTMAPKQTYDGEARELFDKTKEVFDSLKSESKSPELWNVLSMGMSQDYYHAILAGSTHIRIGTAIFGDRNRIDIH